MCEALISRLMLQGGLNLADGLRGFKRDLYNKLAKLLLFVKEIFLL